MTNSRRPALAASTLAIATSAGLALAGCAAPAALNRQPDTFSLGRNAAGEPCTATRNWHDAAVADAFDQSWSINCRNVAASRSLGTVRVVRGTADGNAAESNAANRALRCAASRPVALRGIATVPVRRCRDALLGAETVAFALRAGDRTLLASAVPAVLGPMEEAVRLIAGRVPPSTDAGRTTTTEIDLASLAAAPAGADAGAESDFDPAVALAEGISLNHKGLHVQASRVLNDALSRLPASAASQTRAELLLEAGLADSNIRFEDSAAEHFVEADALLAGADGERAGFLQRKRDAYRALDLLNQRRFREALLALDRLVSVPAAAGEPLRDAAVVRILNQPARQASDAASSIVIPETAALSQLVLDAQANWARSVALLALGDQPGSVAALVQAIVAYRPLITERIDPTLVLWLGARINRQQGRLEARERNYPAAIASFDRALVELRRSAIGTAGTGNEPAIAETQLERAGIIAQQGGDPKRIRQEYDQAVDALIAANQTGGGILPTGMERYLDLLVAEAKEAATGDADERFFRAVQAVGEPAVARQLNQLQAIVTADPAVGVKVRDRAELERDITRLRYEIAAAVQDGTATGDLDRQRRADEARLLQIDAELSSDQRFRTIDDRPATIGDIRKSLRPGEGFLKIVELNARAYGIFIDAGNTWIYPVALPAADLDGLASQIRASIDGKLDEGKLVPFKVAESYALFRLLTGPATEALLRSTALVVDPAGPLANLPAGVLVTDRASVDARAAIAAAKPFDFSHVSFLAAHATISTAVSPRSFLVARALPPSVARRPFLGLGDHLPAGDDGGEARQINVGFGCSVSSATLADLSRRLKPIDRKELVIASAALGVPDAPAITGAAFSDTAVEGRTDLADYEVIHFATHGLEEGVWGCAKSPPALVTSFGDAQSDGLLSFSEIAKLRLDANLVVLSACDTASGVNDEALARRSGQEEAGSTLEGLVRAFLTANSRAVLATFWPVSAEGETDDFIKTFYGQARARNIGGSLQAAQAALMTTPEYSHPFYWGPYFVVGDSTKMMLAGTAPTAVAAAPRPSARAVAMRSGERP